MADDGDPPGEAPDAMERKVQIVVEITCRKGDPLPALGEAAYSSGSEKGDGDEAEEVNGPAEGEEAPAPPPPLLDLGCKFHLTMFNGFVAESEPLDFPEPAAADGEEGGEGAGSGETAGEEGEGGAAAEPSDPRLWKHTFTLEANINEDQIVKLCKQAESSISLRKTGLEVPMVLLPIDLAPMVAGETEMEVGASLASTELVQNPYNVGEFVVRITTSSKFLTPALEEKLNPLCITIVAAEDLPDHPAYVPGQTWKEGANPRTLALSQIREECKPVYCKYLLLLEPGEAGGQPPGLDDLSTEVVTHSVPQAAKVRPDQGPKRE